MTCSTGTITGTDIFDVLSEGNVLRITKKNSCSSGEFAIFLLTTTTTKTTTTTTTKTLLPMNLFQNFDTFISSWCFFTNPFEKYDRQNG